MRCLCPPLNSCGYRPAMFGFNPTISSRDLTCCAYSVRDVASLCMMIPSPTMLPTDIRGSSEPYGSWKMICARLRISRRFFPLRPLISSPSNLTVPADAFCSCNSALPNVVFPLPLSPTSPRHSPL